MNKRDWKRATRIKHIVSYVALSTVGGLLAYAIVLTVTR